MKNDLSRRHRVLSPESPSVEAFDDPIAAVARLSAIYDTNTGFLRDAFARYRRHEPITEHVRACYPFVRIRT
ncbi:MAG: AMP nucleosidase, partial [Burkholderia sp.]|nr:AMP nucleosidase [Burkholderia sp.]